MSVEENKQLIRRLVETFQEVWRTGDLNRIDTLYADNFVNHTPGMPPDREGFKQGMAAYIAAFPDLTITAEEIVAEGNKVVLRMTARGSHQGELMGIPPTGATVSIGEIHIYRIERGEIVERWGLFDSLGLLQQIGAIPAPGQAPAEATQPVTP